MTISIVPLVLHHIGNDLEATLWVVEVPVLDSSFDDVERGRDKERCSGTSDRSDEVLAPGSSVVVLEFVEVLFGDS